MTYIIKPIPFKPPRIIDMSEDAIASYYEKSYGQNLNVLNRIHRELAAKDWASSDAESIMALQDQERDYANRVLLQEVFLDSMGGEDGIGSPAIEPEGEIKRYIDRDFNGIEIWRKQFVALASSLSKGSGWVVLNWSTRSATLQLHRTESHSNQLSGTLPLLALDMTSQAYKEDFASDHLAYINAFIKNLHWGRANASLLSALAEPPNNSKESDQLKISPENLMVEMEGAEPPQILDVCLLDDLSQRHDKLPGSMCCLSDADAVAQAADTLDKSKPVVAYCMYGYQVSGNAAEQLREQGFNVKTIAGGIASWRAIGGTTEQYKHE